jgi:predicted pyridoxine 5'-phosphate oxidase superfamily flavin-nucleotide-binding protein
VSDASAGGVRRRRKSRHSLDGAAVVYRFLDILSTPGVRAAQAANGGRRVWERFSGDRAFDRFSDNEAAFIEARDSFYLATVSETGWPYVQHRGGPPGFLKVLNETTLGFADFCGNRQYISLGNVATDDRIALILMDYPNRARLKILAHLEVRDIGADPDLAARLALPGYKGEPERAFLLHLETFDWNCAQHITPRFTATEVEAAVGPLLTRIAALEAENHTLRARTAGAVPQKDPS